MLNGFKFLRSQSGISERELAVSAGVSRLTLRAVESGESNCTVQSLNAVCRALGRNSLFLSLPENTCVSDSSTIAISLKMERDGFESWPVHLMELVDDFRKSFDPRLLLLPPLLNLEVRLSALLASTTLMLADEAEIEAPDWARQIRFLEIPWFVSETQSLKAMAILESPWAFRRNNIFVLENFLKRA